MHEALKGRGFFSSARGAGASKERAVFASFAPLRSGYQRVRHGISSLRARTLKHYTYESLDTFLTREAYSNGVHEIFVEQGVSLDVLIFKNPGNIPSSSRIPVFFSGALTERENTSPPYFSGSSFARELGQGIIAISDPIFYYDEKITAGWYTGLPEWHTQSAITRILEKFIHLYCRDILCIGGSAGGFAALEAASSVRGAAAFVWNAQTSILDYQGYHIRNWMNLLFGEKWVRGGHWRTRAQELLGQTDIVYDLSTLPLPKDFLYLQNDTDWHVESHMRPYASKQEMREVEDGLYQGTPLQIIGLAHFGDGHARPPRELIVRAVREMTDKGVPSCKVYENLFSSL